MSSAVNAEMVTITSQVRAACAYFATVLPARPRVHPLGEAQRDEVVDDRRAHAAALARVHPVREVEDVERAGEALDGRDACTAPERAPEVRRGGKRDETALDRDAVERLLEPLPREHADRREGDDLVLGARCLGQPAQRAAQVVADPGARVGERRCVDDDAHGGSP